ncbi:MAG: type II toxin-antitoxin system VapC family toxin [Planctomycetaceae bacterium]
MRSHGQRYLAVHGRLAFSAMAVYEILRGLLATQATRQRSEFLRVVGTSDVFPISTAILERAADLWATARTGDHPHADADLIIVATALEAGRVMVTGNTPHFAWIPGLTIEDWRRDSSVERRRDSTTDESRT